jgi:hypothetical protein
MFIFVTDQELWVHELMGCIMGYDHCLGQKDILKFIYYFMILSIILLKGCKGVPHGAPMFILKA